MGKKPATIKKDKVLSVNLSDGKEGGIRKKIQGKATKEEIESYNKLAEEWGFNSRDEMFNAVMKLTLRYCTPLPTDEVFTADMTECFNRFFCMVEDIECYRQTERGVPLKKLNLTRRELELYFLFMLSPFSDDRIKKKEWKLRDKILNKYEWDKTEKVSKIYDYGNTTFQVLNFILTHLLSTGEVWGRVTQLLDRKNKNVKNINDSFADIQFDMTGAPIKLGRNI